jgi:hypothetical protein
MREVVCSDELEGCVLEPPKPNKLPNPKDNEELEKPIRFNYPLVGSGAIGNSVNGIPASYAANNLLPLKGFKSGSSSVSRRKSSTPKKKVVGKGAKRRKIQTSQSPDTHPLTPPPKPKRRSKPKSKSSKPKKSKAKKPTPKKKTKAKGSKKKNKKKPSAKRR